MYRTIVKSLHYIVGLFCPERVLTPNPAKNKPKQSVGFLSFGYLSLIELSESTSQPIPEPPLSPALLHVNDPLLNHIRNVCLRSHSALNKCHEGLPISRPSF